MPREKTKFAVISDVHGNLPALEAVMERIRGMEIICLGDMLGYGPQPDEVVNVIRRNATACVLGNHETSYLSKYLMDGNPKTLSLKNSRYIAGLPTKHETENALFIHGSPRDPLREYMFPDEPEMFAVNADKTDKKMVFTGHTHIQMNIEFAGKTWANPGSVGQPRDGDPRAGYATVDTGKRQVKRFRIEYDVRKAAKAVLDNQKMPADRRKDLAKRLLTGR